jgi:hypothetical protein
MVGICGNALLGRVAPLCIHPRPVPFVFIRFTHLYSFALVQPSWSQSYIELHFPHRTLHSSSVSLQLCCKSSRFYNSIRSFDVRTKRSSDTTHAHPSVARVTAIAASAPTQAAGGVHGLSDLSPSTYLSICCSVFAHNIASHRAAQ